jgi:hypothetical protein
VYAFDITINRTALAAWHSGHRFRLQNRRSRVRIPPGCKVLGIYTLQCCCHNLICIVIVCTYLRKLMQKSLRKKQYVNRAIFKCVIHTYVHLFLNVCKVVFTKQKSMYITKQIHNNFITVRKSEGKNIRSKKIEQKILCQ